MLTLESTKNKIIPDTITIINDFTIAYFLLFFKIRTTLKPLARLIIFKFTRLEYPLLVSPSSHIFLPLWYHLVRIVHIAIRLAVRIKTTSPLLPVIYAPKCFVKIIQENTVEKVFSSKSIFLQKRYSSFTIVYLAGSISTQNVFALSILPLKEAALFLE